MAFKQFGCEDQEGNSETVASLFRECSGLGAEVTAVEVWPRGEEGLTANDEKVARFDVEMVETASDFLL